MFSKSLWLTAGSAFIAVAISVSAADAQPLTYAVKAGDSLSTIAQRFGQPVASIEARNHLTDESVLQIGQSIIVGETAAAPHRAAHTHTHTRAHSVTASALPAAKNAIWVATHTGQAPAPPTPLTFDLARRIVAFDASITRTALRYLGVPYMWGGTSFSGVDCSGFVQAVFEHNGIELPRTADSQFLAGQPVSQSDLRPGDLVFFETYAVGASHVGIFLGGGRFIHASSSDGVRVDALGEDYYAQRYLGARRLIR